MDEQNVSDRVWLAEAAFPYEPGKVVGVYRTLDGAKAGCSEDAGVSRVLDWWYDETNGVHRAEEYFVWETPVE